ncbi:MAG: hypothetical protein HS104_38345 [Polyangiaceae bacterium]|nr:hypothetical protein [Polyangiaceae bacterium]MCE7892791.1 hypothetical protein [Sorangiineae bacterium PRO1]MCL4749804.1 hypothetical protein [Myxococcales bacterium]
MAQAESRRRPAAWAERALPSLRARFYLLLAGLTALMLAPWIVTEELRRSTDGFAVALQEAGSLRFRLLQIHLELPRAQRDEGTRQRVEVLMHEQRDVLRAAVSGDPAARLAPCPTDEVCSRLRTHLTRWDSELEPRFRSALARSDGRTDALTSDVLLEVNELDITVRAAARAIQSRTEKNANLGFWASAASMLLVGLVAIGVWQVFGRIRKLSALVGAADERGLSAEIRGTDELDALAGALGRGIAAERKRRDAEARRAEELQLQQLATHSVADSLSAWIAGDGSLDRALAEVARATGHERAELALEHGAPDAWRNKQLEWGGKQLGTLRLGGSAKERPASDEVLLDTLSQVFAIACLADRLLAEKTTQGRLAIALGGLSSRPDAAELGESLRQLVPHDAAVLELFDSTLRVEDMWAVHESRLERLPALCDGVTPAEVTAIPKDSAAGCPALAQRCAGAQLAVPLKVDETLIGALHLARASGEFSTQDVQAAEALAPVAASALARVQLEARLRFAEQWSTLGAFGRLLAHEIKNPLNSLGLELQLLERRVAKLPLAPSDLERVASSVQVVKSELARLTSLANEYLSMSPKSGALEVRPLDLNEVVASVARTHAASMADRGIHLVDELGPEPAIVLGHPDKLKQLVHNLIGNAIEAMASAEIRVATLSIRRRDGDYELSVRDTGPGIADPVAIFAPGYTTKTSGTGMGLAISQQIARQHGGRLLARALDSGGAEFTLRLAAHDDARPN